MQDENINGEMKSDSPSAPNEIIAGSDNQSRGGVQKKTAPLKNRWRIFKDYAFASTKPVFPTSVVIELTNHCNLACVMCPHPKMTRAKGFMESTLFHKIIDEIKGRVDIAILHGMGESMFHPQLSELIAYASKNKVRTALNTNGVMLTKEKAESFFAAGLNDLLIDFDGTDPESYESIRKKSNFKVVFNNIKEALKLQSIIRKKDGAKKTNIILQTIYFPGQKKDLFQYFNKEEARLIEFRYKMLSDSFNSDELPIPHTGKCYYLWYQIMINWNGEIPICCVDYNGRVILGNANNSSIEDVWNSQEFKNIRDKHHRNDYQDFPMCSSCSLPNMLYCKPFFVVPAIFLPYSIRQKALYYVEKVAHYFHIR